MPRPKRQRLIQDPPIMDGFKPFGIPMVALEQVVLLFEEYESIRLCDYQGLTQEQGAEKMGVSRPTFTRIYEKARQTIAKGFVEGKAIRIEGGNYHTIKGCLCKKCHGHLSHTTLFCTCESCDTKKENQV